MSIAGQLIQLGTKTAVRHLVEGAGPDRSEWAEIGVELLGLLSQQAAEQEATLHRLEGKVDKLLAAAYMTHLQAGNRLLQDLRLGVPTTQDRTALITGARMKFAEAAAAARSLGNVEGEATAEMAIAGCWLWVPSIQHVQQAMQQALAVCERGVLDIEVTRGKFNEADALLPFATRRLEKRLAKASAAHEKQERLLRLWSDSLEAARVFSAAPSNMVMPQQRSITFESLADLEVGCSLGARILCCGVEVEFRRSTGRGENLRATVSSRDWSRVNVTDAEAMIVGTAKNVDLNPTTVEPIADEEIYHQPFVLITLPHVRPAAARKFAAIVFSCDDGV